MKTRLASALLPNGRNTRKASIHCLSFKDGSFFFPTKKKKYKNNGYKLLIVAYNSHNPRESDH